MKNLAAALLMAVLTSISLSSFGQSIENSLFWEISGNGLEKSSYILGTIKFIPASDFSISENVISTLKSSDVFATETLLDHHAQHELNKAAHLPNHQSQKNT